MSPVPFTLRPDQEKLVQEVNQCLQEHNSLLVSAPTGSGKTVVIAEIINRALRNPLRIGVLVHRQELVTQTKEKIELQTGQTPGIVWQDTRQWDRPVTIMAQDTVSGLEIPQGLRFDLLIIDEAHHTVAPGWLRTIERLRPRFLLGFSATPFRQDREPLSPVPFAKVIRPITPKELIDAGILCPALIESPIVHDSNGDPQPISKASNLENIYRQAVRYAIAQGRSKILLYVSQTQEYSPLQIIDRTVKLLNGDGITADSISQELNANHRSTAISRFKDAAGASVLVNYMALTEGTDLPYVDCVVLGRHTASESTIIQMIGRGLRTHPLKVNCLVLDYSGRPDMESIIHYWRIDEATEEGAYTPKEKAQKATTAELSELAVKFPRELSAIDNTRVQYPWFRPFERRPLLALSLWHGEENNDRYITVEPKAQGTWRVTTIELKNAGPSPISKQQTSTQTADEAATLVKMALGDKAPHLSRQAEWRTRPPTKAQLNTFLGLRPDLSPSAKDVTAGETSDTISHYRFIRRVSPKIL